MKIFLGIFLTVFLLKFVCVHSRALDDAGDLIVQHKTGKKYWSESNFIKHIICRLTLIWLNSAELIYKMTVFNIINQSINEVLF
jgi:hypothetical protein